MLNPQIKVGALFIGDAHYNKNRTVLLEFLTQIDPNSTPQIFFMGDIFDFLTDDADYFISINQDLIRCINDLAQQIEVYYLEGNHDFNLSQTLHKCSVIGRQNQPLRALINEKNVSLSHGDIYVGLFYEVFTFILRNSPMIRILNFFDKKLSLATWIENKLLEKKICYYFDINNEWCRKRVEKHMINKCDIILEGHYHQDYVMMDDRFCYINLPAFACSREFLIFDGVNFKKNKA